MRIIIDVPFLFEKFICIFLSQIRSLFTFTFTMSTTKNRKRHPLVAPDVAGSFRSSVTFKLPLNLMTSELKYLFTG